MDNDWANVLIPMIRQVVPGVIAQDIVGVQPMDLGLGNKEMIIGVTEEQPDYPYWAEPRNYTRKEYAQIDVWLKDVMGTGGWGNEPTARWVASSRKYWFHKESDRTMFILKWS